MSSLGDIFTKFVLNETNDINEIYNAMTNEDLSEMPIKLINFSLPISKAKKSETTSKQFCNAGTDAVKNCDYQNALTLYNRALLFAPKNSRVMQLAYYLRSDMLQAVKEWNASCVDIERCLAMKDLFECSDNFIKKLMKKKEFINMYHSEAALRFDLLQSLTYKYFNCTQSNSQVSCASSEVNIVYSPTPKVVAARDIKTASVLCTEKAYVSYTVSSNALFSCHYCQKMSLNLIPCDRCCYALFCDENCKKECFDEFHEYECYIMDVLKELNYNSKLYLAIKVSLKLKKQSKSWQEFINTSHNIGSRRYEKSSIQEIYEVNNPFSILCLNDNIPFVYGKQFIVGIACGIILKYFEEIPLFLPKKKDEKWEALRALARVIMSIGMYYPIQVLKQAKINLKNKLISFHGIPNFGLYSFTGKLKHTCQPNTMAAYKNNNIVLIALRPIKSGEELSISSPVHRLEVDHEYHYNFSVLETCGKMCDCLSCDTVCTLSQSQIAHYSKLNLLDIDEKFEYETLSGIYETILKALEILHDVPNSNEYKNVFARFLRCILHISVVHSKNFLLDAVDG